MREECRWSDSHENLLPQVLAAHHARVVWGIRWSSKISLNLTKWENHMKSSELQVVVFYSVNRLFFLLVYFKHWCQFQQVIKSLKILQYMRWSLPHSQLELHSQINVTCDKLVSDVFIRIWILDKKANRWKKVLM